MSQGLPDYIVSGGGISLGLHDLTHSPVGLWQLQSDLTDSSGNSLDLTCSGNYSFVELFPGCGIKGLCVGTTEAKRSSYDASLAITGALTIEMLCSLANRGATEAFALGFTGSGESLATNVLYQLTTISGELRYFAEYSSGVDISSLLAPILFGIPQHIAFTRSSDGLTLKLYQNGNLIATKTVTAIPEGGTSAWFQVGGSNSMGNVIASLKVIASELSATQVAAEAARCLGY